MMDLKALEKAHDKILEKLGSAHDKEGCPICNGSLLEHKGGSVEYTDDQIKAQIAEAVAAAVKPLQEALAEVDEAKVAAETEAQIAAVRSEAEAKLAEVQTQLDAALVTAEQHKTNHENIVAYLAAEEERIAEEEAAEARKTERIEKIKAALPLLKDEFVDANASRWAAGSDEEFDILVETLKEAAESAKTVAPTGKAPAKTALELASKDTGNESATARVYAARDRGFDLTSIR